MEEFCGGASVWDADLTWVNASWPNFSECFQNTVVIWIPSVWLWVTSPAYIWYLVSRPKDPHPRISWNIVVKMLICLVMLALVGARIGLVAMNLSPSYWKASLVGPCIEGLTIILAVFYICLEKQRGFITSGVLFMYWSLVLLTSILPAYRRVLIREYETDLPAFLIFYVFLFMTLTQWVVHCIAEKEHDADSKVTPEKKSSFLSRITFEWMSKLMIKGYRKTLTDEDMFLLHPRDRTRTVAPLFERNWHTSLHRARYSENSIKSHIEHSILRILYRSKMEDKSVASIEFSPESKKDVPSNSESEKKNSLFRVMAKTYGWDILQSHFFKILYDILVFTTPVLLRLMIQFTNDVAVETWKGYLLAFCFFIVILLQSLFFHQLFHLGQTLALRVRASLIAAIFKKAILLTNQTRKESTTGEIVNLMSVDCNHILETVPYLWVLWSSPIQIGVALYFLYATIGPSMFSGFGVLIVLVPINSVCMVMVQKFQRQLMKHKDKRIKMLTEVLNGIKILKLYAWEMSFGDRVLAVRNIELKTLWKSSLVAAFLMFCWSVAPYLVSLATFATYIFVSEEHYLDAETAFVSITLFNILRYAMNLAPMMLANVVKASVSMKRIEKFLNHDDIESRLVSHDALSDNPISIKNGSFMWDHDLGSVLEGINVDIPQNSLVAVVGQVGVGKSSLISAMLGEMIKVSGSVHVTGSTAYVPQTAWIQNETIQENILFMSEMEQDRYNQIVEGCALNPDLEMLPGGDLTEIGEKGINLSGGQKQRVSLARAVYFDADIYLLDDPLSAVDSHVGKHIFEKVIGSRGLLKNKTRILVTHGLQWLPHVDQIIVITNGQISETGSFEQLLSHDGAFAQLLKTYLLQSDGSVRGGWVEESEEGSHIVMISVREVDCHEHDELPESKETLTAEEELTEQIKKQFENKLIQEEKVEVGRVKWGVFAQFAKALGVFSTLGIFLLFGVFKCCSVAANFWLSDWTSDTTLTNRSMPADSSVYQDENDFYLGVYGAFGAGQAASILAYLFFTASRMIHASRSLHSQMLETTLRSPMSFFDTTPLGRVVNRFSQDIQTVDAELSMTFQMWMDSFFVVVSTFIVISYSTPIFMSLLLPLGILYILIQRFYVATSRQLKRLDSTTRSPIYNNFSETLTGSHVIRAFGMQNSFINTSADRVDKNQQYIYATYSSNRWLGFRLEFVGNIVIFGAAMFAVYSKGSISGSIVGLSISYALEITQTLNWFVRMTSEFETKVIAIERIKDYSDHPREAELILEDKRPHPSWPDSGVVEFKNYSTRYREGLELVLKNITAHIKSGEKVGVVGRTGGGKSSLTISLFRLIEPANGSIVIDDIDVCSMGLHDLRTKLTILPQEPVLFSGGLRMNLDPLNKHTDEEVWTALENVHLKAFVQTLPTLLEFDCGEGGSNLSVGQKQLVCLARSLLRKTKVLVLDEATAAVDMETDDLIQKTIRTEFRECTVLTIAHRLNTVMDYDRILVLDAGEIKEFDSPDTLLADSGSTFYKLAHDAGIV
ncbi:hypothetical protein ScPMuIL_013307 [Solemya velum]